MPIADGGTVLLVCVSVHPPSEVLDIFIDAADFSRIRKVKLDRFTVDRLMTILDRLDQDVEVSVSVRPRSTAEVRFPV